MHIRPVLSRLPLILPLILLPLLLLSTQARAHAILMESTPKAEAVLPPGPIHLVLRFNSRIDQPRSRLELRGGPAGRTPTVLPLTVTPAADTLVADTVLPPGEWSLRWQVLAVDGHLTRGEVPVSVRAQSLTSKAP